MDTSIESIVIALLCLQVISHLLHLITEILNVDQITVLNLLKFIINMNCTENIGVAEIMPKMN